MPILNTSTLLTIANNKSSGLGLNLQNFNPSLARLSAANLIKGGASSIGSTLGKSIGGTLGGSLGGALGSSFGGAIGGALGNSVGGALSGTIGNAIAGPLGAASNALAKTQGILNGLGGALSGISRSPLPGLPSIEFGVSLNTQNTNGTAPIDDWRIRLRCPAFNNQIIVFPVLPTIVFSYAANYNSQRLTHSNYSSFFYESSEVQEIQITTEFPVQNTDDGKALLETINFLKAATKMYFGTSANGGNPPPIVFIDGYGKPYLSDVSCVVTRFQHTMPDDVDYIKCENVRLPTLSQVIIALQPVISRSKAGQFNHELYKLNPSSSGFI